MIEFSRHAFSSYDADVQSLLSELTDMATEAGRLIALLADAIHHNTADARQAKDIDKAINQMEYDVLGRLHGILGKYSPSVSELRALISTVRVSAALEHIGDIAKVNIKRLEHFYAAGGHIPEALKQPTIDMLDIMQGMLRAALQNMVAFDTEQLVKILEQDGKVDEIYLSTLGKLQAETDSRAASGALAQTMFILLKDVERAADHAFEMGRIAYYAHTGVKPRKRDLRKS